MDLLKEESSTLQPTKLVEGHRLIFRRNSAYWISRLPILIEVPIKDFRYNVVRCILKLARLAGDLVMLLNDHCCI